MAQPCPAARLAAAWLHWEQAGASALARLCGASAAGAHSSPVVGFGGSYGGMLGSWFRIKYPHIIDGVIAASAPIWNFYGEVRHWRPALALAGGGGG